MDIYSSRQDGIFQTRWIEQRYVSLLYFRQRNVWHIPLDRASLTSTELYRDDEGKIFLIVDRKCAPRSTHRSLPFRCSRLRDVIRRSSVSIAGNHAVRCGSGRRAAQFAHYRESEDKRAPFLVSSAPLKEAPRYVFPRSRAKRFARAAHFAKTWLRRTRKRSRSGFILHLWRRARMLFLSKLSPIWNICSLTLRTGIRFLDFFPSSYPDAPIVLENCNFSTRPIEAF